jgi:serine-type D-Ala-D-Ala carboxypeptidase/endopeptidase (penicillin-binding protein 4)
MVITDAFTFVELFSMFVLILKRKVMKGRIVYLFICLFVYSAAMGQAPAGIAAAVREFEADVQMKYAMLGFAVMDARTGKMVYERNANTGLAPASTQKIITSAAAFELLGKDYRYKTQLGYTGKITAGKLEGDLYMNGSGDPTLGSKRYAATGEEVLLKQWIAAVKRQGIKEISGDVTTSEAGFSHQGIPNGWIWEDVGNYYGAGAFKLNWKENQYDLKLSSGNAVGDSVKVINPSDAFGSAAFVNELRTAAKGTGDNAYIYLPTGYNRAGLLAGTIPAGERSFSISGAISSPVRELVYDLTYALMEEDDIHVNAPEHNSYFSHDPAELSEVQYFHTHQSPPLDSINYWFMRRSINLYGEALVKTIAYEKKRPGSTAEGVKLVRDFFQERGIDKNAINIVDGSGLSPQNRVTAGSLVSVLQFARTRPWHASFYESLPTYNGMKLKSGSIGGARAFAGYHTSKAGKEYIIAIIVNNYSGASSEIVKKMYKVLDVLK